MIAEEVTLLLEVAIKIGSFNLRQFGRGLGATLGEIWGKLCPSL